MQNLSFLGNNIVGSEIIKISQQIKEISKVKSVLNLSIGDFNPQINPIPEELKNYIVESYTNDLTNYPMSAGELGLRKSISQPNNLFFVVTFCIDSVFVQTEFKTVKNNFLKNDKFKLYHYLKNNI